MRKGALEHIRDRARTIRLPAIAGAVLAAATASAQPVYPYPYPDPGPIVSSGPLKWSSPGSTSLQVAFPPLEQRSGQLLTSKVGAEVQYRFHAAGTGNGATGEIGRSSDSWTLDLARLDWHRTVQASGKILCPTGGCTPFDTDFDLGPLSFNDSRAYEPFDPRHPDAYANPDFLNDQPITGALSVRSTRLDGPAGTLSSFTFDTTASVTLTRVVRPWRTTDVLAGRCSPAIGVPSLPGWTSQQAIHVDAVPRFGFLSDEAAHLGQYHHFNWLQVVYEYRTGVTSTSPGTVVTCSGVNGSPGLAAALTCLSDGSGIDPRLGSQLGKATDDRIYYFDEEPAEWADHGQGLRFLDAPSLGAVGDEVRFMTSLMGVRDDGSAEMISLLDISNRDDFTFRWKYLQDKAPAVAGYHLKNLDPAFAGNGRLETLGQGFGDVPLEAIRKLVVPPYRRGDANGDGAVDLADPVFILFHLFLESVRSSCEAAEDVDGNGTVEVSDSVALLEFLFLGGKAPTEPFAACGIDASPSAPSCRAFAGCGVAH